MVTRLRGWTTKAFTNRLILGALAVATAGRMLPAHAAPAPPPAAATTKPADATATEAEPAPAPPTLPPIPPPPPPPQTAGKPPPAKLTGPAMPAPPTLQEQALIRQRANATKTGTNAAGDAALAAGPADANGHATGPGAQASALDPNSRDPNSRDPTLRDPNSLDPNAKPTAASLQTLLHGEFGDVGMRRLVSPYDYVAIALGPTIIGSALYLNVDPGFAWYTESWSAAFHAPLNLSAVSLQGKSVIYGQMKVRREDWQEVPSYLKVIRFFNIGHKEDPVYVQISSLEPQSMGHSMLLNRYQPNIDINRSLTGALVDVSSRYVGFQGLVNDLTFTNRVVGALVFAKPLGFLENPLGRSLSLGAEVVADLRAPRCIRGSASATTCVQGSGNQAGTDVQGNILDKTFVRTDRTTGRYAVEETVVKAAGVSSEIKIYVNPDLGDIKLYGTYHQFLNAGGGSGMAAGLLGRFTLGTNWLNAFRLRTEYRNFGDGFQPSYFDTTYEINKYEFAYGHNPYQVTPTKYQAIFGDPANGFAPQKLGRRQGFKFDTQWALYHGSRTQKRLMLGFGIEDSTGPNDSNLYVHMEMPAFHALQFFATYLHLNEASFQDLFKKGVFALGGNSVTLGGLRLRVLPILWLSVHYAYTFQPAQSPGTEYHLGGSNVLDRLGRPSPYYKQSRLFQNSGTLSAELEFGWDFDE